MQRSAFRVSNLPKRTTLTEFALGRFRFQISSGSCVPKKKREREIRETLGSRYTVQRAPRRGDLATCRYLRGAYELVQQGATVTAALLVHTRLTQCVTERKSEKERRRERERAKEPWHLISTSINWYQPAARIPPAPNRGGRKVERCGTRSYLLLLSCNISENISGKLDQSSCR